MKITMANGGALTLPGCLARFGAHLGVISPACELTHVIKRGGLWKVNSSGSKYEHLGIIDRIEV